MAFVFLNDFESGIDNGIVIDIKVCGSDEDNNVIFFEYKDDKAVFMYDIVNSKQNISEIKHFCYYYSDEPDKRFLCADFSESIGKFYLSSDYRKMVLFNDEVDEFLKRNLETEYLDVDLYLDSDKVGVGLIKNVILSNGNSIIQTNSVAAQLMIKYDEDYSKGLILSEEEMNAFQSLADDSKVLCFYYGEGRYLNTESLILKRVAYRKASKYNFNEFMVVRDYLTKNKIADSYIAVKKSFNICNSTKEDVKKGEFYNIIISSNGRYYYAANEKDCIYFIEKKEAKIIEKIIDNRFNVLNNKYDYSFFFPKEVAIKIINWLYEFFEDNVLFPNVKIRVFDGKIEKEIEDYFSALTKIGDLRRELEILKNEGANLNNELLDKNNQIDKYRKLQKDYASSKIENQDLKNRIVELSKEKEELEKEIEEQNNNPDVANVNLTKFIEWFFGHDYLSSCKWKDYDNIYANMDYYFRYYIEYKNDNARFFKNILNHFVNVKKQIKICIIGGGNGWEVSTINETAKNYNFDISVFVIDKIVWPINELNNNENLNSCTVQLGDYSKILKLYSNEFDIIYFSRIINYTDSSSIKWNEFSMLLNDNQESVIAFAQIVLDKTGETRSFENVFEENFQLKHIAFSFRNKTELFILENNAYNALFKKKQ